MRELRAELAEAYQAYQADDGKLLAGGIAFFCVLSLAPTVVIALALASRLLGGRAVSGALMVELKPMLGSTAAAFVAEVIQRSQASGFTGHAAVLGALVTVYASTRVFVQIHLALNRVWRVKPRAPEGFKQRAWDMLRKRLVSFALVLGLGVLLSATVLARTLLSWIASHLGLVQVPLLWRAANLCLSFAALACLLAAVYRVLPDARIGFRHALRGGVVTASLLTGGALVVGLYFDTVGIASAFGAAGSLVVFMLSAYYGAQIFLFGAELTGASARREGALPASTPPWAA